MANRARAYLKKTFMNADGTFKLTVLNTMQAPALFAFKNHLVEGEAKENVIARLRQNFADHGNCLQTGFLGTSILMTTLTENGMADIAYELLFQRKNPSWLYSVDNGATTVNAAYHSAAGYIKSSWKYEGNEWIWTFTIPEGSTASVTLPGQSKSREYASGTYTKRVSLTRITTDNE